MYSLLKGNIPYNKDQCLFTKGSGRSGQVNTLFLDVNVDVSSTLYSKQVTPWIFGVDL